MQSDELVPAGLHHTLAIINHRNRVLDAAGLTIPATQYKNGVPAKSETEDLRELINVIIANNDNLTKYQQYYWPAASFCYAYEPDVKPGEELHKRFKAHNWYLPSSGELVRQYWYYRQGRDSNLNIFASAINSGVMEDYTASARWSSSEYGQAGAWLVHFSGGNFTSVYKYYSFVVRAVCAF